jgi:hypothetical protein
VKVRATEGHQTGIPAVLRALHTIKSYPFDLREPIFAQYPAMKCGERQAVRHYAKLLAPLAERMIAKAGGRDWVLVSPPAGNLLSGANMVCADLYPILCEILQGQVDIRPVPLRLIDNWRPFQSEADFQVHGDYASLDYASRCRMQYGEDDVEYDRHVLEGREVLFVNDINVTGSHLRWIRSVLGRAKPLGVHALLIVNTFAPIGRRFPQLESELNASRLSGPDELISFLRNADLRCTGKLVVRLLALGSAGLGHVLRSIGRAKRRDVVRAMFEDGSYADDFLKRRLASLQI